MKKIKIFVALIVLGFSSSIALAQESNFEKLSPFTKINIAGNSKVIISIGTPQSIQFESPANGEKVELNSRNGTLIIDGKPSQLKITMPLLNGISISGSGDVVVDSLVKVSDFRIDISGSGKVAFKSAIDRIQTNISGIGKIALEGNVNTLELNISGSGKLNADKLIAQKVDASISGVGKAYVDVRDELILNISGSGTFYYLTEPPKIKTNISGIGKYKEMTSNDNNADTTTVSIGSKKIIIIKNEKDTSDVFENDHNDDDSFDVGIFDTQDTIFVKPRKSRSHWGGLDLGFNQLLVNNKFSTSIPSKFDYLDLNDGKSINVNLNIFYHDFEIYKRYIMFTTGIGLTFNNYRFSSDRTLRADTNRLDANFDFTKEGSQINYEKNKLAINYVTVPLLLQFNTNPIAKKSWHFATGLLLSYKYNSHLKLVYTLDGDREKTKRQDDFNIEPLRADATFRFGFNYFTAYTSYSLTELFKDNRGAPQLHPFTVGINIAGW